MPSILCRQTSPACLLGRLAHYCITVLYSSERTCGPASHTMSTPPTPPTPSDQAAGSKDRAQEEKVSDESLLPVHIDWDCPKAAAAAFYTVKSKPGRASRDEEDEFPAIHLKQSVLQQACKRRRLSSSGRKQDMVERLRRAGFNTATEVSRLAHKFERSGRLSFSDLTATRNAASKEDPCRTRDPNFTKHEVTQLCHVLAQPKHFRVLSRLYNRPDTRAELDRGCHDPWSNEFVNLFNDDL